MKVLNRHYRRFPVSPDEIGLILDTLASEEDLLWPHERWPGMRLDRGLLVGSRGGHGPVRYWVREYVPGEQVRFQFSAPDGFEGQHAFMVMPVRDGAVLEHAITMEIRGRALLTWPLLYRPLHDALIEDALDKAARALGEPTRAPRWSWWVRLLRRMLGA